MKIIEDDKGSTKKRFLFSRLFAEIYYFFAIYLYAILIILGAALSIAVFLFFAELIFPQAVLRSYRRLPKGSGTISSAA